MKNKIKDATKIIIGVILLSAGVAYAGTTWSEPGYTFQSGKNVDAPINVGVDSQKKIGSLILGNTTLVAGSSLTASSSIWSISSFGTDGGGYFGKGVRLGNNANVCNSGIAGTIRYNSNKMEYCNGTAWKSMCDCPTTGPRATTIIKVTNDDGAGGPYLSGNIACTKKGYMGCKIVLRAEVATHSNGWDQANVPCDHLYTDGRHARPVLEVECYTE